MPQLTKQQDIQQTRHPQKKFSPALARDNVNEAFAGRENLGPRGSKVSQKKSTNVKSRASKASKEKTPIR